MTQAEIKSVTPEQVREYYIGSVLNGGGSWPGQDKHATPGDWVALADRLYEASMSTDMQVPVPVIWGTDAVHGHGDRTSVMSGKSVSIRVDLGGRRLIQKKQQQ